MPQKLWADDQDVRGGQRDHYLRAITEPPLIYSRTNVLPSASPFVAHDIHLLAALYTLWWCLAISVVEDFCFTNLYHLHSGVFFGIKEIYLSFWFWFIDGWPTHQLFDQKWKTSKFKNCVTQLKLDTLYKLNSSTFCCLSVRDRCHPSKYLLFPIYAALCWPCTT